MLLAWIATASSGSGRGQHVDVDRRALRAEHVAGSGVRELGDRRDVARRDLVDGVLLLAPHREQLVHPLVGLRAGVRQHVVVLDRALQHLEQVHVADVGVDDRLEHQRAGLTAVERGRGRLLDEELREAIDADELGRAPAQHREHRARRDTGGECARELGDVDLLVAEVALHEIVVADDDALHERVVHRVLLGLHLVGHRAFGTLRRAGRVVDRDVVQQVDDAREARFLADRQLQRRHAGPELRLQLVERARERCAARGRAC